MPRRLGQAVFVFNGIWLITNYTTQESGSYLTRLMGTPNEYSNFSCSIKGHTWLEK